MSRIWTQRPIDPVPLNRAHPIGRKFHSFYVFGPNWELRDLVAGTGAVKVGTGATMTDGGLLTSGDVTNFHYLPLNVASPTAPPISFVVGNKFISGSVPWSMLGGSWDGWYGGNSTMTSVRLSTFDGGVAPVPASQFSNGIVRQSYAMIGANNLRGVSGGGNLATDTACSVPSAPGNSVVLGFAAHGQYDNPAVALFEYFGVAAEGLDDAELREMSITPWIVLEQPKFQIWMGTATAGGGAAITDTATGADAIAIWVAAAIADTASGNDLDPAPLAALGMDDTAAGSDAAAILAQLLSSDTGAGTDALALGALLAVADTGSGADDGVISVAFTVSDSGLGTDAVSVITALLITISDLAAGSDAIASVQAQIALSDSATGADAHVLQVSLTIADSASGADVLTVLQQLLIQVSDIAAGIDSLSVGAGLSLGDTGAGLDGLSIAITVPVGDAGSGSDAAAIQAWLVLVEAATGMDAAVAFDSAQRIATITFTLAARAITFGFATRSISFSLN